MRTAQGPDALGGVGPWLQGNPRIGQLGLPGRWNGGTTVARTIVTPRVRWDNLCDKRLLPARRS
ncbi:hypothetical protein GCM10010206_41830 [Streptomyces cinerochromogenes]|nr:hypothetical protein GCM10010206_41830 [Streptomyces cinerochromogenes]